MIEIDTRLSQLQASVEATRARARELRAASLSILRNLEVTRRELIEVSYHTDAILKAVRQHLASLRIGSADQSGSKPGSSSSVLRAMTILGRDECDLDEMTDDLIGAFKTASAVGDDEGRALFANALMLVGRHLATQISPKDAGVVMN
ncbi:hypothetical protein [Methylobacterium sp. A52T]